jgi:AcrR family transcriptional regulator
MQIQKDEIRNKINEAALEEFLVAGYTQSSMRNIASNAGITVGNIYSYFSSKEHLFESLLSETVERLHKLISIEVTPDDPVSSSNIEQITQAVAIAFMENRIQFLILMDGSVGSKYENIKSRLVELVSKRIHEQLVPILHLKSVDSLLSNSLAVAVIEGIITIFRNCGEDYERLKTLLSEFMTFIFGDLPKRM